MSKKISHTFVICAYKQSKYLEECIASLVKQTVKSNIIMVTSTPSSFLEEIAEKYRIPLKINNGETGITQDWNFGYRMADTEFVTIAHQDDVYLPEYAEMVVRELKRTKKPLIAFTDYGELRDGKEVYDNKLLNMKRKMLLPLRIRRLQNLRFVRRRILSFGCAICWPSVTFAKDNLPGKIFRPGFRSCEDWEAWEMLSKKKGAFVYVSEPLMLHRIHAESETSAILEDHARTKEDYVMFCKFWPKIIAKMLVKLYATSEKSNQLL